MPRSRKERIGRIVGAAGAACGSLFWGVALYAVAGLLIEPTSAAGIALLVLMPMVIFASLLLVVSAADLVVLARRVDLGMPIYVASSHAVISIGLLWIGQFERRTWLPASILLAIALSQLVAICLFRQITPSHASSQR